MADFQLDKKQNRSAAGLGAATGGASGAAAGIATGASIGAAAGGGVLSVPGALIGAAIGGLAMGALGAGTGAGVGSLQDKQAQKDAYEIEQAQLSAQKKAEIDQSAAARAASTATASPSMQYMGLSRGGSAYDSWRSSVYGG